MKQGGKKFQAAVDAAVEAEMMRRQLAEPITYRNLTVNFEAHTFTIDGRTTKVDWPAFTMPILSTEHVIQPSCHDCMAASFAERVQRSLNEGAA